MVYIFRVATFKSDRCQSGIDNDNQLIILYELKCRKIYTIYHFISSIFCSPQSILALGRVSIVININFAKNIHDKYLNILFLFDFRRQSSNV